jgi:hypothetical protein
VSPEELTERGERGCRGGAKSYDGKKACSSTIIHILSEKRVQSSVMRKLRIYLVTSLRVLIARKNINKITKKFLSPCVFKPKVNFI